MFEVHEDTTGALSVWRDPYLWVDPFAEAEAWALRCGELRQHEREDRDRIRRSFGDEIAHLNWVIEQQRRHISALSPMPHAFVNHAALSPETETK